MLERFGGRIKELEEVVRELAIEITTDTVVDRLPPLEVWKKTGDRINVVRELINELREYLYILKPERVPTTQRSVTGIFERFDIFKESLNLDDDQEIDTTSSIDELRKALSEISDFVSFCRDVKDEPSEVIQTIMDLRENQRTDRVVMTPSKMMNLGNLITNTQATYSEIAEMSLKIQSQLSDVKSEYDELYFSLSRKENEGDIK